MSNWRAQAYHLTRNRRYLLRLAAYIVGAGLLITIAIQQWVVPPRVEARFMRLMEKMNEQIPALETSTVELGTLLKMDEARPDLLLQWLRGLESGVRDLSEQETKLLEHLSKADFDSLDLLKKHTRNANEFAWFSAYVQGMYGERSSTPTALKSMDAIPLNADPISHANEMRADLLVRDEQSGPAITAYLQEIKASGSPYALQRAVSLIDSQQDTYGAKEFLSIPAATNSLSVDKLHSLSTLARNPWLLAKSHFLMSWERWWSMGTLLAFLTAAVWYVIVVWSGEHDRNRWWQCLPAILAGMLSALLVLWARDWFGYGSPREEVETPTHEMLYWIMYVGVPEEAAKLLMFIPFLPWLLRLKSAGAAAVVAGCVGLGFALEENILYFDMAREDALGRLLTANFLHIALTGLAGFFLYHLIRSRFNLAGEFLTTFAAVCVAHGLYDFVISSAMTREWGFDILSFVILALCARFYFQRVHDTLPGGRELAISRSFVFVMGASVIISLTMILIATQGLTSLQHSNIIFDVLTEALQLALIGFIYLKQFDEV